LRNHPIYWSNNLYDIFALQKTTFDSILSTSTRGVRTWGIWVEGTTFFHKACALGLINSVAELLRQGSDINVQNDVGHTPLFVAAGNGRLAVLHLLLKEPSLRADILVAGYSPPIKIAVSKGHEEIVRLLLQRDDAAANTTGRHDAPLNDATKKGRKDIVKLLLDWKDINVDATDKEGQIPLWWAYDRGRQDDRDRRDIVQMLLNKEASVRKLPRGHPLRAGQSEADEDDEVEENSHITTPSNAPPETPNRVKSRSTFRKLLGRLFGRRP
jgi:ankyrin repeat protein